MNADGSGQTNLTNDPAIDSGPVWSPDGSRIAFTSGRDEPNPSTCLPSCNIEVYVMNADGSGQTNLTNDPGIDSDPTWSPDGSRIAFTSDRDGDGEIYVINADGSGQTNLTDSPADDSGPTWSPDGGKIAFDSDRDGNSDVFVMNADGTDQTNLTNSDPIFGLSAGSAWSPDGTRIAFINQVGASANGLDISVMNADGSNLTSLTFTASPIRHSSPTWSPDGSRIAFIEFVGEAPGFPQVPSTIYVVNADGSDVTALTNNPDFDGQPVWSPDGSRIAFRSRRDDGIAEINVMNADGSGLIRLAETSAFGEAGLAWSPDGASIAFVSVQDGDYEIYVMSANGSGLTNLTNHPGSDTDPIWSPGQ
jgi:Tol biopolymer transport system component